MCRFCGLEESGDHIVFSCKEVLRPVITQEGVSRAWNSWIELNDKAWSGKKKCEDDQEDGLI